MTGENLSPSRAARLWVSSGDATLVATNAEWNFIAYMCRCIDAISNTLTFPLHTYSIQIGTFHYSHQIVLSLLAIFPSQFRKKASSLWKALLPNSSCRAVVPGVQHQELIPPLVQERAAGSWILKGGGVAAEGVLESERLHQFGCSAVPGTGGTSKGSDIQGEDTGQKEDSKGTQ